MLIFSRSALFWFISYLAKNNDVLASLALLSPHTHHRRTSGFSAGTPNVFYLHCFHLQYFLYISKLYFAVWTTWYIYNSETLFLAYVFVIATHSPGVYYQSIYTSQMLWLVSSGHLALRLFNSPSLTFLWGNGDPITVRNRQLSNHF